MAPRGILHRPGGPVVAILCGLAVAGVAPHASAQEVLLLHIRPRAETIGSAGAALAAREAAWARSNARARIIIESVCTGCLSPWYPSRAEERQAGLARSLQETPQLVAAATDRENPVGRGLEPDRSSEASDATFDPSSHERRP